MAQCAKILALVLPILVFLAHIMVTTNFTTDRQLTTSSCPCRRRKTSSSPSHQPPCCSRAGCSSFKFKVGKATVEPPPYRRRSIPSPEKGFELEPEPAVLAEVKKTGLAAVGMVERMEHLAKVLRLFGYNHMASAVPLLADSWVLRMWSGPVTVFAVPDAALVAACTYPYCPLRTLLLKQIAMGSHPFSHLSSRPSFKITTPAIGFCMLTLTTIVWSFDGDLTKVVSINSVEISRPNLYNDGWFTVHGVRSYIHLPNQGSCTQ